MTTASAHSSPDAPTRQRPAAWGLPLSVFFFVAAIRLLLVARLGGDAPYLDEVNHTGYTHIFASEAGSGWGWLVSPHMEHRLVTLRLYSLQLAWLNAGQWDTRVELSVSALLWGLLAGGLAWAGGCGLAGWRRMAWCGFILLAQTIPHAWENLLWAFQVQFVFLVGFSLASLWCLVHSRPLQPTWWLGVAFGAAATLSQAAGLLVWCAGAVLACEHLWRERSDGARSWAAFVLLAGLALVSWKFIPPTPFHEPLRSGDPSTFLTACVRLASWPWEGSWWMAALMWAPGATFGLTWLRRGSRGAHDRWLVAMLAWAAANLLAAAWARGSLLARDLPPSRYADVLVMGVAANALVLLSWHWNRRPGAASTLAALWLAAALAGMSWYTRELSRRPTTATSIAPITLPQLIEMRPPQAEAIRAFTRSGDEAVLVTQPLIYPVAAHLAGVITRLQQTGRWPATLDESRRRAIPWLSAAARRAEVGSAILFLGGVAALGAAMWHRERRGPGPAKLRDAPDGTAAGAR